MKSVKNIKNIVSKYLKSQLKKNSRVETQKKTLEQKESSTGNGMPKTKTEDIDLFNQ